MLNKKYESLLHNAAVTLEEAVKQHDVAMIENINSKVSSLLKEVKKENELMESTSNNNFGYLNDMLSESIPYLMKTNKKLVKESVKLIREDKNLSAQFQFYDALKNYNGNDANAFINEALNVFNDSVDKKTIKESNKKFGDFIRKNNLVESIYVENDLMKLYEDCDYLLSKKSTLGNITEKANKIKNVVSYLDSHKAINENKGVNTDKMFENYSNKLSSLNESDQELVKQIIDFKTPIAENNKKKLHDKIKNDILEGIDKMLASNDVSENDKKELETIKEDVFKKEYCKETIVTDIAKLLEIRDVILDK